VSVEHYENFPVASWLLPARLREPVEVIYRFARSADDFADEGDAAPRERLDALAAYRAELGRIEAGKAPQAAPFHDVERIVREYALPISLFADLLDAFSQDVTKQRYTSFAELLDYCRRSANPVGRLLLHLFGKTDRTSLAHSDAICSALQLINFWQDVEADFAKGRIYLPQDEMREYGVSEGQIPARRCDERWRALIEFQIERSRALLLSGAPLGRALPGRIGLEIRATAQGGLRILDRLHSAGCDMFRHRPVLRWYDWPLLLMRSL
jgi:squalene synthase HpnC